MPVISMFYGILVYMYAFDDKKHSEPHIHVEYADKQAIIAIKNGRIIAGKLPKNKLKLVQAWVEIHHDDLMADWKLAISGQPVIKIKPLE